MSITLKAQHSKGDSPASEAVVVIPRAAPTPLPQWPLAAIIDSLGRLGYRRLSSSAASPVMGREGASRSQG